MRAEVQRPTHTICLQNERADVHVPVTDARAAGLDGEEESVRIRPRTPVHGQRIWPNAKPIARDWFGALELRVRPEDCQWEKPVALPGPVAVADYGDLTLQQPRFEPEQLGPVGPTGKPPYWYSSYISLLYFHC